MRRTVLAVSMFATACGGGSHTVSPDSTVGGAANEVDIDSGSVRGQTDGDLVAFLGIPYATAGRWQPPVPPAAWTEPRAATSYGPVCPQAGAAGSEDCLTLNVWAHAGGPARPVIVWIHGGGYVAGSAHDVPYDGAALARATDATVVSIEYRLGVLGFLALPQLAAPDGGTGNWGLRDQIAALEWVHRNIAAFGGDPAHVMIDGESAGGASICTLLAAPAAQGLFAAAVDSSGPCRIALELTSPVGTFPAAEGFGAVAVAAPLGCTSGDIAACLRSKSVAQILALNLPMYFDLGFPLGATLPVVDGVVLDQRPLAAVAAGRGNVPLVVGSNRDDASVFIYQLGVADTAGAFDSYLQAIGQGSHKAAIEAIYPTATFGERGAAIAYATDVAFACGAEQLATAHASSPAYLYELDRPVPNGPLAPLGAVHGLDFIHLFGTYATWQVAPTAGDLAVAADLRARWAALARGATPGTWPAATGSDPMFLRLDDPATTATGWRSGRCAQLASLGLIGN